jgi:hypothetical protein
MLPLDLSPRSDDDVDAYVRSFEPNQVQLVGHRIVLVPVLTGQNRRAIWNNSKKFERTDKIRALSEATVLPRTRPGDSGSCELHRPESHIEYRENDGPWSSGVPGYLIPNKAPTSPVPAGQFIALNVINQDSVRFRDLWVRATIPA